MNILLTCNKNYLFPLLVLLESIFENNKGIQTNIYLLYNSLDNQDILTIKEECDKFKQNFYFYKLENKDFDKVLSRKSNIVNLPIEAYFRLLAGNIIPENVKKILYLDLDIVINKSLVELYCIDLENNVMAACEDIGFVIRKDLKRKIYKNLGFSKDSKYFNAGVILFDLECLRKIYAGEEILNFLITTDIVMLFGDQCCLNYLFRGKVKFLDYDKYNCRPFHYPLNKRSDEIIIQNATIIHYGPKPWLPNFNGLGGDIYLKYAKEIDGNFVIDYAKKNKLSLWFNNMKLRFLYYLFNMRKNCENKKNNN